MSFADHLKNNLKFFCVILTASFCVMLPLNQFSDIVRVNEITCQTRVTGRRKRSVKAGMFGAGTTII